MSYCCCFLFCLKEQSHASQTGLRLAVQPRMVLNSCLYPHKARMTGTQHHTWFTHTVLGMEARALCMPDERSVLETQPQPLLVYLSACLF